MAELNPAITGDSPLTQMRLISTRSDADGMPVTITKVREAAVALATATPPSEVVSAGIWTKTDQEPISDLLCWKVTESRVLATGIPGATVSPIIREDKWNNELGVMEAHFWQYVPDGTTKQIIGATYSTGESYVSDSITAVTVNDPGSGYLTPSGVMPILTTSAPNGAGGAQALITVTNLKLVSGAVSAPGSGYALGTVVTLAGGTFSTAATLTATSATLASLDINAAGTGYVVGDLITLAGGTGATPATITVSTIKLVSLALNAAGTGYVPGNTLTLVGGTFSTASTLTVSTTKVVSVSIVYAGTGGAWTGTPSAYPIAATTGAGTKVIFQASNNAGGQLSAISVTGFGTNGGGSYTANPADIANEPLATNPLNFPTDPPIVSVVMGVATFVIAGGGSYTVGATTFTHTGGSGTGATFQTGVFGVNTVAITAPGQYVAPAASSFTAASTTGSGTDASFYNPGYTITQWTVTNAGAYTQIPASPNAVTTGGSGLGLTLNLSFGIGVVTINNAGTKYYYPPTITPSYGSAVIAPTMSTPILLPGSPAGYVVDSALLNTEHALIKRLTWTAMPLPPTRVEYQSKSYPLPDIFTFISDWVFYDQFVYKPPFPGVNYTNIANGVSTNPARVTISYSNGPSGSVPATWHVITPGVQSKIAQISQNTIHNAIVAFQIGTLGGIQFIENTPASTPASYIRGQTLIIDASERRTLGNFYEKRIMTIT